MGSKMDELEREVASKGKEKGQCEEEKGQLPYKELEKKFKDKLGQEYIKRLDTLTKLRKASLTIKKVRKMLIVLDLSQDKLKRQINEC